MFSPFYLGEPDVVPLFTLQLEEHEDNVPSMTELVGGQGNLYKAYSMETKVLQR